MSETAGKHDFALGKTGTAPPTPTLLDPADRDDAATINTSTEGAIKLNSQSVEYPITSDDDSISIAAFSGVLADGRVISFPADTVTGLANSTQYGVFWDIGSGDYVASVFPAAAQMASSEYVFLGWASTSTGGTFPTAPTPPGGWGGNGPQYNSSI